MVRLRERQPSPAGAGEIDARPTALSLILGGLSVPFELGWNGPTKNSSSRWLLHSTGEPTFASPTIDLSRARRRSSLSGSGNCAWNRPRCDTWGTAGSAESVTPRIPACGGSACSFRFSSFSNTSLFCTGTAGRTSSSCGLRFSSSSVMVRCCFPSDSSARRLLGKRTAQTLTGHLYRPR